MRRARASRSLLLGGLIGSACFPAPDGQPDPGTLLSALLGAVLVLVAWAGVAYARSISASRWPLPIKQVRTQLIETARPVLEALVQEATGEKALSLHHDISTVTGEEVVLFTLSEPPRVCDARKNEGLLNRGRQRGWNRGLSPSSPRPV